MTAVFRRELKSFFCRLSSYVFLGLFLCTVGLFMLLYNFSYGNTGFEYPLSMLCVSLAMLLPLISNGIFVRERHRDVERFLGALPISPMDLIAGKLLAMLSVLGLLTLGLGICPLILNSYGEVYFKTSYAALLAFFLIGSAFLCIDFFLALTVRSRTLLWTLSYAIPVAMIGVGYLSQYLPHSVANVVSYLSFFSGYTPFGLGVFDLRSVAVWCSVSAIFIVLSIRFSDRIHQS